MATLSGYITNLGKYNEGELVGKWIELPIDEDDFEEELKEIGIGEEDEFGQVYEEYFWTDWECDIPGVTDNLGEYVSLESVNELAEKVESVDDEEAFGEPTQVLMLPKDSLYSFFENKRLNDNKNSYLATYSSQNNTYTFYNISGLITRMYQNKLEGKATEDWNKVVLVPVNVSKSQSSSYGSTTITDISNEMALKSTRLVGGAQNKRGEITISIIYNRLTKDE